MTPDHPAPQGRLRRAVEAAARLGAATQWAVAASAVAGLGFMDFLTGYEVSFALFYLLPVAFAGWFLGRGAGVAVSLGSAAAWLAANELAGQTYSSPVISYWNSATRLGFFLFASELLVRLRGSFEALGELTRQDHLTGVLNARGFYEAAEGECERLRRSSRPLTVAYLDLDGFKGVNDSLGHQEGDRVLQAVAAAIRRCARRVDTVARLGGDEFALLLPETDLEVARGVLERLREALLGEMRRGGWAVSVSVGAITCARAPESVDDLVRRADNLMYEVKAAGKNAVRHALYEDAPRPAAGAP